MSFAPRLLESARRSSSGADAVADWRPDAAADPDIDGESATAVIEAASGTGIRA